jgi:hypothetical protein
MRGCPEGNKSDASLRMIVTAAFLGNGIVHGILEGCHARGIPELEG